MPKFNEPTLAEIETTIDGIPCIVAVTEYDAYVPARIDGPPEFCYPEEGGEAEYRILDRKGYLAEWLENKITPRIDDKISDLIFEHMENQDEY